MIAPVIKISARTLQMRSWRQVSLIGVAAFSMGCGVAQAASSSTLPDARPPGASALRGLGVQLTWPLHRDLTTVRPGQRISVTVRRAGTATPRLVLMRIDAAGTPVRAVMGDQGRHGRLTVTVPQRSDLRYQLRLQIGRQTFWGWVQTPPAPPEAPVAPPPAPPAPTTPPPSSDPAPPVAPEPVPPPGVPGGPPVYNHPGLPCPASGGTPSATSTVSATSGHVGDTVRLTMTNTGNVCLYDDLDTHFERQQTGGSWQSITEPPYSSTDVPERNVANGNTDRVIGFMGDTWTTEIRVWSTLAPGHYRIVKSLRTVSTPWTISIEFDVLA
jgi:hypothetical protein